jgi:hypothetical protein
MRCLTRGLLLTAALALLPTVAAAAEPTTTVKVEAPSMPTPLQAAILGLALTAVVVVGARAAQRTSGTMMFMVLASLAVTGVFVAASYRVHTNFDAAVGHLQQAAVR